ncbi:MAG: hypothetical protein ACRBK7_10280 [Acidimicrobiales bacterium]
MTIISLFSCSGAPGATTVALATTAGLTATSVHEPVMIEMAASGGVLASQYDLPSEPGLMSLALAIGNDYPDLLEHAQELPGGVPVVVAPPSSSKTTKLLDARAVPLARYLQETPATIVADCGRVSPATNLLPILELSSLIGLVIRPTRESFQLAATTINELNELTPDPLPVGWILVGHCPWSHDEIISQYGVPVFGVVAEDRVGAEAVAGLRRLRKHSPLARSAQSFAEDLAKHLRIASISRPLGYLEDEASSAESTETAEPEWVAQAEVLPYDAPVADDLTFDDASQAAAQ